MPNAGVSARPALPCRGYNGFMDVEKTIQFILEMQAKHEAWLQKHEESIVRIEASVERIGAGVEANTARMGQLVDVSLSLAHHGEEVDRRMEETGRLIKELRDAQAHSDYRLNALIDAVEKLIRRNGSAS